LALVLSYSRQLPSVEELAHYQPALITRILDRDHGLIAQFGAEKRMLVTMDQVAPQFIQAIVAVEDVKFFVHQGVDFRGIARALLADVREGRKAQGASTITQQLARNLFLTKEKTFSRKFKEVLLAIQIERRYSKQEILELYMNQIFFGSNAYGIEAAARIHFDKPAMDLCLAEAALLAGLPQSPSRLSPFKNMQGARDRMGVVLSRMVACGFIAPEDRQRAMLESFQLNRSTLSENEAPYFVDYVRGQLERDLGEDQVWRGGLTVVTTLDLDMQAAAQAALDEGLAKLNAQYLLQRHHHDSEEERDAMIQGGLIALSPQSGEILAMVGGTDYIRNQWNRTTQALRQPGSAFKPLLFATAFQRGFAPAMVFQDAPIIRDSRNPRGPWMPGNYDNRFYGPTTLAEAIIHSRNIVAIKLLEQMGMDPVIALCSEMLGIAPQRLQEYRNLTMALGSVAMTPLEIASSYCVFANRGVRVEPHCLKEIRSASDEVLHTEQRREKIVLSQEAAYLVTDCLKKVITLGTGQAARLGDRPVAGKTGTTDNYVNAWFVGYTPELCCAVYVGYDDRKSMGRGQTGGVVAAPIWARFMTEALKDTVPSEFPIPAGIVFVNMDGRTGRVASNRSGISYRQAFVAGTEPKDEYDARADIRGPRAGWILDE